MGNKLVNNKLPGRVFSALINNPILLKMKYRKYGYFGGYKSWQEAEQDSIGYDSDIIIEKVTKSVLKVAKGEVAYERDSVNFDKIHYAWPLLAGLMWIAAINKNKLNVLDFGGALGSTYFQCRHFLKTLDELHWNIIEQKKFVDKGKKYLQNDKLRFYYDIPSCLKEQKPNVLVLSSVVHYLPKPYDLLKEINKQKIEFFIIDRTPFSKNDQDQIMVQRVHPAVYHASYPCWFLNRQKVVKTMTNYELVAEFDDPLDSGDKRADFLGYIFRLKK